MYILYLILHIYTLLHYIYTGLPPVKVLLDPMIYQPHTIRKVLLVGSGGLSIGRLCMRYVMTCNRCSVYYVCIYTSSQRESSPHTMHNIVYFTIYIHYILYLIHYTLHTTLYP